jgi:hypothetical protein
MDTCYARSKKQAELATGIEDALVHNMDNEGTSYAGEQEGQSQAG